jgi:hypothetical protein
MWIKFLFQRVKLNNLYCSPSIDEGKDDEMVGACSTHREKMNPYRILMGKPDLDLDLGGRIILRWILEK